MKTVTIYTDGACSGNPGPGGWGAILQYGEFRKELSGGEPHTTNNRMELTGVITALEALKEPCEVELYSDSKIKHTFNPQVLNSNCQNFCFVWLDKNQKQLLCKHKN